MRIPSTAILIALVLSLGVGSALAHHSVRASFDDSAVVSVTGAVTKIDWGNPHVHIYLDVKDDGGGTSSWILQMSGPGGLEKSGFEKNLLNTGAVVRADVWVARTQPKSGIKYGNARTITLSSGQSFDVSDKWPDPKK